MQTRSKTIGIVLLLVSLFAGAGATRQGKTHTTLKGKKMNAKIVRISRGWFDPKMSAEVAKQLDDSAATLVPAIKELKGNLRYYVGIDRAAGTMTNVSIWDSLEHAKQMDTLAPMLAQRKAFEALGIRFDPIINYETLWEIE